MKKIIVFILLCLMIFSVACQPTPEKPFVESKNDGELESSVYGEPAPELENGYEAPETWTETLESDDGITVVNIDAKLNIPDVTKYPVYRVNAKDITVDDAKAFIRSFVDDETIYYVDRTRIKSIVEKHIEMKLNEIAKYDDPNSIYRQELANGVYTQEEFDNKLNAAKESLAALQEEYKSAPVDYALTENNYEFKAVNGARNIMGIVMSDKDEGIAQYFHVQTDYQAPFGSKQAKKYISKYTVSDFNPRTIIYDFMGINHQLRNYGEGLPGYDQAKAFADDVVYNKLGYSDYELRQSFSQELIKDLTFMDLTDPDITREDLMAGNRFVFAYTKTVDNIPMLFYLTDNIESNINYSGTVYPHFVLVFVKDEDDYEVLEQSTIEVTEQLNSNAALLPFDEIQDIFRRYIMIAADESDLFFDNTMEEGQIERATFDITDIRLGYVRIPEKNNAENGLLVPVWNFYGQQTNKYKETYSQGWQVDETYTKVFDNDPANAFLCINAIDGSIIDLDLGY